MNPIRCLSGLVLGCSLLLPACASSKAASDGDALFRRGDFGGARLAYQRAVAENPARPELAEKLQTATRFFLLEEGRRLSFLRQDFLALKKFEEALALDPQDETAEVWVEKSRGKIVRSKVIRGFDLLAEEDYAGATESFREALLLAPGNADALGGLARIRQILDQRLAKSEDYVFRGIRDKAANLLYQAEASFGKAALYDPANPEVEARGKQVKHQLAEQKFLEAQQFERERRYGAALVGYRTVRSLSPEYPELADRIAAVETEVKAEDLLRRGKLHLGRGEYGEARRAFEEGRKLSRVEKTQAGFDEKLKQTSDRELAALYLAARTLEQGARYAEALGKFEEILKKASYYEDTIARIDLVKGILLKAEELYGQGLKAEEARDWDAALKAYEEVFDFYPTYKDVALRIDRIRVQED